MSQMRWSKQLAIVDLDTGVYFWTNAIRHFAPLCFFTELFVRSPTLHCLLLGSTSLPCRETIPGWDGWAESRVGLCCAAAHSHQSQMLLVKAPGHPLAFIPVHLSDRQDIPPFSNLSSISDHHHLLPRPPSACNYFFFWDPLFPIQNSKPLLFPIQIVYVQKHNVWPVS